MSALRARAAELALTTPWQKVADSPVTKYYTDWRAFEEALRGSGELRFERPDGEWDLVLGPCGTPYNYDIDETLLDLSESRLYDEHVARLDGAHVLETRGLTRVALCKPVGRAWFSQHLTVNVPPGSEADIIVYAPRSAPGTTGVEVRVKEGSRASLLIIAEPQSGDPMAFLLRRAVGVRASLSSMVIASSSAMTRVDEETVIATGGTLSHSSVTFAWSNGKVDNIIDTVQSGRASKAIVSGLGVASDSSMVAVRGTAVMLPNSPGSYSNFVVEALLLGDSARAYTMPMMRIETGEVEVASHRAAQYRLPQDQLFYLQARGLTEAEATELIVQGRTLALLELSRLPSPSSDLAREFLYRMIRRALQGAAITPPRAALAPS